MLSGILAWVMFDVTGLPSPLNAENNSIFVHRLTCVFCPGLRGYDIIVMSSCFCGTVYLRKFFPGTG